MRRRDFIAGTAIGATALALNGCHRAEEKTAGTSANINRGKKVTLKLATSWPAHFPIMGTGVDDFAKRCYELSGGTLEIKVYYWKGKNPAFSIFGGMPLGLTSEEMITWMKFGGGYELWREMYGKFNLYPLIGGTTGPQMGGWFKKEINSLADLKGLKMRIPGLGGEVNLVLYWRSLLTKPDGKS